MFSPSFIVRAYLLLPPWLAYIVMLAMVAVAVFIGIVGAMLGIAETSWKPVVICLAIAYVVAMVSRHSWLVSVSSRSSNSAKKDIKRAYGGKGFASDRELDKL